MDPTLRTAPHTSWTRSGTLQTSIWAPLDLHSVPPELDFGAPRFWVGFFFGIQLHCYIVSHWQIGSFIPSRFGIHVDSNFVHFRFILHSFWLHLENTVRLILATFAIISGTVVAYTAIIDYCVYMFTLLLSECLSKIFKKICPGIQGCTNRGMDGSWTGPACIWDRFERLDQCLFLIGFISKKIYGGPWGPMGPQKKEKKISIKSSVSGKIGKSDLHILGCS